jgi:hypothetical protein
MEFAAPVNDAGNDEDGRKTCWHRSCLATLSMPSNITVVIADATRTAAIRSGLPLSGRVAWFTGVNLVAAFDSIQMNHPKTIAVESAFAQTDQGQAFLARIERLAIRGSDIRLVVRDNGTWATTPYTGQPATDEPQAVAATTSGTTRLATGLAGQMAVTAQAEGANTRRASRFKVLESLNAVVGNGQANLVNISILGAQVVSDAALSPTKKVEIALPDTNRMLPVTAYVAWSTFEQSPSRAEPHYRAGLSFTDAAQEILEDYCRRHCSQDPLPSY